MMKRMWQFSKLSWPARTAFVGVGVMIAIAFLGPLLLGTNSLSLNLAHDLEAPSWQCPLGKAENGIDVLAWLVFGARISLSVAFVCTAISLILGAFLGAFFGYMGGKADALLMRVIDVLLAFPGLLLAIYIAAVLQPGIQNIVFALCATGWVSYARITRAQVLSLKERDFIQAARCLGASRMRIVLRHLLPNCIGPLIVQASFGLSAIILGEAALSFLGLGVPLGTPSWGVLLDQGVSYLFVAPHIALFSGICISISVLCLNLLGDGLRDLLEVRSEIMRK